MRKFIINTNKGYLKALIKRKSGLMCTDDIEHAKIYDSVQSCSAAIANHKTLFLEMEPSIFEIELVVQKVTHVKDPFTK